VISFNSSHILLDSSASVDLTENDEKVGLETISSENLVTDFNLALAVGRMNDGRFGPLLASDEVDVGQSVRIMLQHSQTSYKFSLLDCKASAGSSDIELYDGACPNAASQLVNIQWNDFVSFDISIFRFRSTTTLTFVCTVAVFPTEDDLPTECVTEGRKRRQVETEPTNEVSVTLNIAPSNDEDDSLIIDEDDSLIIDDNDTTTDGAPCTAFDNLLAIMVLIGLIA